MTDNDPAVEKRYIVLDEFYDASSGRVHNLPPDLCPGESRALLVPCDDSGTPTPEALAAIPQVRELLDAAQAIVDYAADGERLWARLHRLDLAVRTLTGGTE